MTLSQINTRLEELKLQKTQIKGQETEVYARIVGYYRSVRNWNKGKKEEYGIRLNYADYNSPDLKNRPYDTAGKLSLVQEDKAQKELLFSINSQPPTCKAGGLGVAPPKGAYGVAKAAELRKQDPRQSPSGTATREGGFRLSKPANYLYFFRETCPNCLPVAAWLNKSGLEGRRIDVDRESGMHEALRYDISAAPTVVFLDGEGKETGRGCSVAHLESQAGITAAAGA